MCEMKCWMCPSVGAACVQISRLLVVDPALRLTAEQALAHSFFRQYHKDEVRLFSPRKTFRVKCLAHMRLLTVESAVYCLLSGCEVYVSKYDKNASQQPYRPCL